MPKATANHADPPRARVTFIKATLVFTLVVTLASALGLPAAENRTLEFTTDEGTWISLDVTFDGNQLVLELLGDLYTLPVNGGTARPLLSGRAFRSQPRYSPDGTSLVYISDGSGSDNVWLANAEGSNERQLTDLPRALMLSPAWSADGKAIFVTVIADGGPRNAEIWRYPVSTQGEAEKIAANTNGPPAFLVSSPAPGAYGPQPAPDGKSLLFTSVTPRAYGSRNGATSSVVRLDLDTGRALPMTLGGTTPMKPALTPDGSRLVYAAVSRGRTGLRIRDLVTGAEHWLHYPIQRHQLEGRATRDVLPNYAIAPDGSALYAAFDGKIHRIALEDHQESDDRTVVPLDVVPFEATVRIDATPALDFPRRVDTGPVRARRLQHLAVGPGDQLAFTAMTRIFVASEDGGQPTRLTATERPREHMPAWSPDGRWLCYVTWDETGGHLWKAEVGGAAPIRLSRDPALWIDPVWSPDGASILALRAPLASRLAAAGRLPDDLSLIELPVSGGASRSLVPAGDARRPHFAQPSGSSSEAERVYLSSISEGLISVDRESGDRRIDLGLSGEMRRAPLKLSPSGRQVAALVGNRLLAFEVPEGSAPELSLAQGREVSSDGATAVAWSSDGSELYWLRGANLGKASVANANATAATGTAERRLTVEVPRAGSRRASAGEPGAAVPLVLRGAKLITMRDDEILQDADLVIRDDRIVHVGPRGSAPISSTNARILDLAGKVIVPGFVDVHAHFPVDGDLLEPESITAFANLAFGVTSLRNPQVSPDVFALADVVAADGVPSPRIFSTGPGLALGFSGGHYGAPSFSSLDEVRRLLQKYRDEYGTHLLKSYLFGNRQQRQWVIEASRELEMMPTTEGGADTKANLTHAIDGFSGNEHGFPVAPIYDDVVQLVARSGMTYTPTLVVSFGAALPIYRLLAEKRPHQNPRISQWFPQGELYARTSSRVLWFPPEDYNDREAADGARKIVEAGGRVALGGHGEVQGLSNHWEMELLARGGMSHHDVLRVATLFGAEAIGYGQDLGSLEVGKLADLVVLDRDPLEDILATTAIHRVMKGGVLYDAATLDQVWPEQVSLVRPWWLARELATPVPNE